MGPETRLRERVVHAEQVHRDRAGRGMAGHERVANEREHTTAKCEKRPKPALCEIPSNLGTGIHCRGLRGHFLTGNEGRLRSASRPCPSP